MKSLSLERRGGVAHFETLHLAAIPEETQEALVRESPAELAVEHEVAGAPGAFGRDHFPPRAGNAGKGEAVPDARDVGEDGSGDAFVGVEG